MSTNYDRQARTASRPVYVADTRRTRGSSVAMLVGGVVALAGLGAILFGNTSDNTASQSTQQVNVAPNTTESTVSAAAPEATASVQPVAAPSPVAASAPIPASQATNSAPAAQASAPASEAPAAAPADPASPPASNPTVTSVSVGPNGVAVGASDGSGVSVGNGQVDVTNADGSGVSVGNGQVGVTNSDGSGVTVGTGGISITMPPPSP